ncbi:MAG: M23 family metallopeptidase [bacterium]|nr:M23 family metallopeptidase [bacterium]
MMRLLTAIVLLGATQAAAEGLSLPFSGRWFVAQAGDSLNVNHHMSSPAQFYGIDFVKAGGASGRELARGTPSRVSDYYSWGEDVLAPGNGTVVAVVSDLPDNPLGTKDPKNHAGNYVVIQIDDDQFVFLAHMQQGTVTVAPGDNVQQAQTLGLCGNSGYSDYPHIHFHVQDTPTLDEGTGQNPTFGPIDVELTGKHLEAVTWPLIRGLFVSNSIESMGQQIQSPLSLALRVALSKSLQLKPYPLDGGRRWTRGPETGGAAREAFPVQ